jgi:hypothetical protein
VPAVTPSTSSKLGMLAIRYGIGIVLVLGGLVLLIVDPGGFGVDGFAMAAGSGFSVIMLNFLYRLGVSGDTEREREEVARDYLAKHGRWPDDPQARPAPGRRV